MNAPSTQLEPNEIPDELKPVNLFFQQAMNARNAPDYVREAWQNFLVAVRKWTVEEGVKK